MLERLVAPHLKGKNGAKTLNIKTFSLMTLQMALSIMNLLVKSIYANFGMPSGNISEVKWCQDIHHNAIQPNDTSL